MFFHPTLFSLFTYLSLQHNNVSSCLSILRHNSVPGVENITADDIIVGRLKAVLSLFFSLSRFEQATKLKTPIGKHQQANNSQAYMMQATRYVTEIFF